jgi:prepilin-type N-terminal cleavage/methylation domain-containing protein
MLHTDTRGFSLVELSIVLVILGLLTGGILGGQALIRAAEMRAVGTEYDKWQAAVYTFKQKYFAYPGDFDKATQFWLDSGGNPVSWDGNNNGRIDFPVAANSEGEVFTFWQHLALAGLIEGEFTGLSGSNGAQDSYIGENVPGSKFSSAGWSAQRIDLGSPGPDSYNLEYGSLLQFGAKIPNWEMGGPVMSPEEAWNIDTKLDDGQPAKGKIIARFWNNLCAAADDGSSANNDYEASYRLSDTSNRCALYFRNAF